MTDRLKGFIVTFDKEIREDDAEALKQAILQIRNVIDVSPIIDNFDDSMARARVKRELAQKLWDILKD